MTLAGEKGVKALQSQPFRLQSSRCWGEGDRRITCVACHVRINRWNGSRSPTTADACNAIARSGAVP